MIIEPLDYIF
uniref:Uncharacterized protein n=1 Tax=Arundo donax TaxID=35708 RepID=A0A0A9CGQ3_ARUDO